MLAVLAVVLSGLLISGVAPAIFAGLVPATSHEEIGSALLVASAGLFMLGRRRSGVRFVSH